MPEAEERRARRRRGRSITLRAFELALVVPMFAYIGHSIYTGADQFADPLIVIWIAAIMTVDLLPVPTTVSSVAFSLSFPAGALGGPALSDAGGGADRLRRVGRSRRAAT